jgi:hypothetical protein
LIDNIHLNDNIIYKQFKQSYRELTVNELNRLPSIYRFSGDYEPILNDIEIFNKEYLKHVQNIEIFKLQNIQISDKYYIQVVTINQPTFNIGDIMYIHIDISDSNTQTSYIDYTTHIIKDIIVDGSEYIITLDTMYDIQQLLIPIDIEQDFGYVLNGVVSTIIKSNYLFDNLYTNFGINKDINIAKVYKDFNLLKSNKDVYDTTSKYPFIDEHGSTNIDRNIFKSPYDLKYYYFISQKKQINNNEK